MNRDWRSLAHCVRIEMGPVLGGQRRGQGWLGWSRRGIRVGLCSPRGAVQSVQEHQGGGGEDRGEGWWKAGERRRERGGGRSRGDKVRPREAG